MFGLFYGRRKLYSIKSLPTPFKSNLYLFYYMEAGNLLMHLFFYSVCWAISPICWNVSHNTIKQRQNLFQLIIKYIKLPKVIFKSLSYLSYTFCNDTLLIQGILWRGKVTNRTKISGGNIPSELKKKKSIML